MNEDEVRGKIRKWIVGRAKGDVSKFDDNTPILETGALSSLDVVELVIFLEQLRGGEEIPPEQLNAESIYSVAVIYSRFFDRSRA